MWNQTLSQALRIPRESPPPPPLKAFVKDSNFLSRDAVVGFVDVPWSAACVARPGEWAINQVFKLGGTF